MVLFAMVRKMVSVVSSSLLLRALTSDAVSEMVMIVPDEPMAELEDSVMISVVLVLGRSDIPEPIYVLTSTASEYVRVRVSELRLSV